ncbi:MAG: hypothetical protein ACE5Q3_16385 [Alphaproteobacteria bacterium]
MRYESVKYGLSFLGLLVLPFIVNALLGLGASPVVYAVVTAILGTAVFYAATSIARRRYPPGQFRSHRWFSIAILLAGIAALIAADHRSPDSITTYGVTVPSNIPNWWPTDWECLQLTEDEARRYGVYFRCSNFSWSWSGTDI